MNQQANESARVWVHRYKYWDADAKMAWTSDKYATIEAIRMGLGVAMPETAMKVDQEDIKDGIYVPKHEASAA